MGELIAGTFTVGGVAPFFAPILIAVMLHPAASDIRRPPGWDLPMLGLAAAAALPWVMYAAGMGQAAHNAEPRFEMDHLTFVSALALMAFLWGIIGASTLAGWQYAAWLPRGGRGLIGWNAGWNMRIDRSSGRI